MHLITDSTPRRRHDHPLEHVPARLAQLAERKALNLVVVGSSPTSGDALFFDTPAVCQWSSWARSRRASAPTHVILNHPTTRTSHGEHTHTGTYTHTHKHTRARARTLWHTHTHTYANKAGTSALTAIHSCCKKAFELAGSWSGLVMHGRDWGCGRAFFAVPSTVVHAQRSSNKCEHHRSPTPMV